MTRAAVMNRFAYSRNGDGNADEKCLIRVQIPAVSETHKHTRYQIEVTNVQSLQSWQVWHRYSEFLKLRDDLVGLFAKAPRKCPGCVNYEKVLHLFEFPSKRLFTSKNPVVINYRKKALRAFVALLASHSFTTAPKCPTCSAEPFTLVRDFLTEEPVISNRASASGSDSGSGGSNTEETRESIRESINVKRFTTYVPVPALKPVSSEGVFIRERDAPLDKPTPASVNEDAKVTPSPLSTASTASLPGSPDVEVEGKAATSTDEGSFVSFSGPVPPHATKTTTAPPPPTPQLRTDSAGGRKGSKRRQGKNSPKSESPRGRLDSELSVKESMDEEFGSLNMDFMQSLTVKPE